MRIFVVYEGDRVTVDVDENDQVLVVKDIVREAFSLGADQSPSGLEGPEKKILVLHHQGADLDDHWPVMDVGISSGATIKAVMRDQIKPVLYIHSVYNNDVIPILEKMNMRTFTVAELRSIVTRKSGIPVGAFRLMSPGQVEMFDCHTLDSYEVEVGNKIRLETWDGWNEFLNLVVKGLTSQVFASLNTNDDIMARYQMKLALYMAAHFGHVDLAVSLLRQGIRADEPVGDHPSRLWCRTEDDAHIDSLKAPVHEASEMGQLGVLRSFVHHNVCNVLAKDGNQLTPLNIALRKKQKPCASFLLTKQWSKINYTSKTAIPLNIFVKMKRWGDRAKDKVLVIYGQWKSSVKNNKRYIPNGALVGHGVLLDGYSTSKMASKPANQLKQLEHEERDKKKRQSIYHDAWKGRRTIDPETYFKGILSMSQFRLPKLNKWGKMLNTAAKEEYDKKMDETRSEAKSSDSGDKDSILSSPEPQRKNRAKSPVNSSSSPVKLPPIQERFKRGISQSHQNLTMGNLNDVEADFKVRATSRSAFIQTGYRGTNKSASLESMTDREEQQQANRKKKLVLLTKNVEDGSQVPVAVMNLSDKSTRRSYGPSKNANISKMTLQQYEKIRGLTSRDYAVRCLTVANSFKEKPWLHRVRQAMAIASQGVKKTVTNRPHMFVGEVNTARSQESSDKITEGWERETVTV